MEVRTPGLTGCRLKQIALVTMLIDHVGAVLIARWYALSPEEWIYALYAAARCVGRIAFPIFCFLLVEGFLHTRSPGKYALRLGLFALLSEIPFDLAVWGAVSLWDNSQNVYFTLLLGLAAIWSGQRLAERTGLPLPLTEGGTVLLLGGGAELFQTDYGFFGVLLIAALFLGRKREEEDNRLPQWLGAGAILCYCWSNDNWVELLAVFGLLLTASYNGARGRGGKWFFYWFYPAHLGLLALLNHILFP